MKAFDFSVWNDVVRSQREAESKAYCEFIDLTQAIVCEYKLDMYVRSEASCEDSVARGRFISGLIGLYLANRDASWPDFLATEMDIPENNRNMVLKARNKGAIVGVVNALKEYAKGSGFTFTL